MSNRAAAGCFELRRRAGRRGIGVDPAAIAESQFWSAFLNNGQTCA